MTLEYIIYAVIGILLTTGFSIVGTRIAQAWGESGGKTEKLIKEHEERSKDDNHRIEKEFLNLEKAIKNLETLIQEVRLFVAQQSDKNNFVVEQFKLLWDKHNDTKKEIDDVKNRVSELEHKDKYGKSSKQN
ncbi:MAG: hypothetical protein M9949_06165 [Candidatus Kapabacteria bacterium]|nr:hypothetical protein [Candidatus Kapabacteria bacterium]